MHISIVILNWNGKAFLEAFLSPLLDSITFCKGVEVIVADNGSTDGSVEFLRNHYPQLRLIQFQENFGYTGGYNKALQQIEATYYVLLNSDVQVTPCWLEPLLSFMELHPQVGMCMPKIRSFDQLDSFEYAGASGGFIDYLGYPFCRGRILSHIEKDTGQYNAPMEIFWASGVCLMMRAKLFHQLGGFDTRFFAHQEEIDLCWRAKMAGSQVWVIPQSCIHHVGGGTLPNDSPHKLYLNYRNNLWMLYKNLPKKRRFTILILRFTFDSTSALLYLLQGKKALCSAVFKAHCHFWKGIKEVPNRKKVTDGSKALLLKHTQNHNAKQVSHIWHKSIVWYFFLHKKKLTFDQLVFPEGIPTRRKNLQ